MAAVRKTEWTRMRGAAWLPHMAVYSFEHTGGVVRLRMKSVTVSGNVRKLEKDMRQDSREGIHARAMHEALQALEAKHGWGANKSADFFVQGFGETGFGLMEKAAGGATLEKLAAHYRERFGNDYQAKKKDWPDMY